MNIQYIYELCDNEEYEKAIFECEKLLKRSPAMSILTALKAICVNRLGDYERSLGLITDNVLNLGPKIDFSTLHAASMCLRELSRPDMIPALFEQASKNEETLPFLFQAYLRVSNVKKQLQMCVLLYNMTKSPKVLFWRIASIITEAHLAIMTGSATNTAMAYKISIPLAQKLIENANDDHLLVGEEKYRLSLELFDLHGKMYEAQAAANKLVLPTFDNQSPYKSAVDFLVKKTTAVHLKDEIERKILLLDYSFLCNHVVIFLEMFDYLIKRDPDDWILVDKLLAMGITKKLIKPSQFYDRITALYDNERKTDNANSKAGPARIKRRGPFLYMIDCYARLYENPRLYSIADTNNKNTNNKSALEKVVEEIPDEVLSHDKIVVEYKRKIKEYFDVFGTKYCCAKDMAKFLTKLLPECKAELFISLSKGCSATTTSTSNISNGNANYFETSTIKNSQELLYFTTLAQCHRQMNLVYDPVEKVNYVIDKSTNSIAGNNKRDIKKVVSHFDFLISFYLKHYMESILFSSEYEETELKDADALINVVVELIMEVSCLIRIHENYSQLASEYLRLALVVLHYALGHSKYNASHKLLFIRICSFLGVDNAGYTMYKELRIKSIQIDSVAFIISHTAYKADHSSPFVVDILKKTHFFYDKAIADASTCLITAYDKEVYSQIYEFELFRYNIKHSVNRYLASYDYVLNSVISNTTTEAITIVAGRVWDDLYRNELIDYQSISFNEPENKVLTQLYRYNIDYTLFQSPSISEHSHNHISDDMIATHKEALAIYTKIRESLCSIVYLILSPFHKFKMDPFDNLTQLLLRTQVIDNTTNPHGPDIEGIANLNTKYHHFTLLKEPIELIRLYANLNDLSTSFSSAENMNLLEMLLTSVLQMLKSIRPPKVPTYDGHNQSHPIKSQYCYTEFLSVVSILVHKTCNFANASQTSIKSSIETLFNSIVQSHIDHVIDTKQTAKSIQSIDSPQINSLIPPILIDSKNTILQLMSTSIDDQYNSFEKCLASKIISPN